MVKRCQSYFALLVEFRGPRQATCSCINPDHLAEAVINLTSGERILNTTGYPEISLPQASIVEKAVSELRLPYADVARILRHISVYRHQDTLHTARQRHIPRRRGTPEAGATSQAPRGRTVIRLGTKKVATYQILPKEPLETGRYIATGNALLTKLRTEDMKDNDLKTLLSIGGKAASELQEPYRSSYSSSLCISVCLLPQPGGGDVSWRTVSKLEKPKRLSEP